MENDPRDRNPLLSRLLACQSTSMAQFAAKLQSLASDQFAFPVEDATGLTGAWDFTLSFTPQWMLRNALSGPSTATASEPTRGISLADAISKQMGLKLEIRKRTLPVVVIDHIDQVPDEN